MLEACGTKWDIITADFELLENNHRADSFTNFRFSVCMILFRFLSVPFVTPSCLFWTFFHVFLVNLLSHFGILEKCCFTLNEF